MTSSILEVLFCPLYKNIQCVGYFNLDILAYCFSVFQKLTLKYVCNGEKGKPLMLLQHGFPESWYSWRFQLKEFSDQYW